MSRVQVWCGAAACGVCVLAAAWVPSRRDQAAGRAAALVWEPAVGAAWACSTSINQSRRGGQAATTDGSSTASLCRTSKLPA